MALVSLAEAAKLVGRSKRTLYRDVTKGCLSVSQDVTGVKMVDTSELIRVYGGIGVTPITGVTVTMSQHDTPNVTGVTHELVTKNAVLEAEIKALRERLEDKEKHLEDMRNTVRLLEHKTIKKPWWKL